MSRFVGRMRRDVSTSFDGGLVRDVALREMNENDEGQWLACEESRERERATKWV